MYVKPEGILKALLAAVLLGLWEAPSAEMSGGRFKVRIENRIKSFAAGPSVSVIFRDAASDSILIDINGNLNIFPASTLKLITTWAALCELGPEKKIKTTLSYSGKIESGILDGNLVITGNGDPAFGSRFFGKKNSSEEIFFHWYEALKKKDINKINGCVFGSGKNLNCENPSPYALWEDIGNYYGGFTSGLCFMDNRYKIFLEGGNREGAAPIVTKTVPEHTGIDLFDNRIKMGPAGSKDLAYIFGSPLSVKRNLRGTYPSGKNVFFIGGSLPFPQWTCAMEFRKYLDSKGIEQGSGGDGECEEYIAAAAEAPGRGDDSLILVAEHLSPSIGKIIRHVNQKSDNNYAQQLLCLISKEKGGDGSAEDGILHIKKYLNQAGVNTDSYCLRDGSGLSRCNWITASAVTKILCIAGRSGNFTVFQKSLITSPRPGSVIRGFGSGWHEKLWLKTGTMEGIYSVGGYLKTSSGKLLAFYFSINNTNRKLSRIRPVILEILKIMDEV